MQIMNLIFLYTLWMRYIIFKCQNILYFFKFNRNWQTNSYNLKTFRPIIILQIDFFFSFSCGLCKRIIPIYTSDISNEQSTSQPSITHSQHWLNRDWRDLLKSKWFQRFESSSSLWANLNSSVIYDGVNFQIKTWRLLFVCKFLKVRIFSRIIWRHKTVKF